MTTPLLLAVVAVPPLGAIPSAQTLPVAERPSALNRLNFMEGRWKLAGSVAAEKGRQNFESTTRCDWLTVHDVSR